MTDAEIKLADNAIKAILFIVAILAVSWVHVVRIKSNLIQGGNNFNPPPKLPTPPKPPR